MQRRKAEQHLVPTLRRFLTQRRGGAEIFTGWRRDALVRDERPARPGAASRRLRSPSAPPRRMNGLCSGEKAEQHLVLHFVGFNAERGGAEIFTGGGVTAAGGTSVCSSAGKQTLAPECSVRRMNGLCSGEKAEQHLVPTLRRFLTQRRGGAEIFTGWRRDRRWGGRASARPRASRRLPLPVLRETGD